MTKPGITGLGLYGYGFLVPQSPYLAECRFLAGKIRWLQQLFDQEGDRYHAQRPLASFQPIPKNPGIFYKPRGGWDDYR